MDRFLKSLLISLGGSELMISEKTLSDIAKALLVHNPDGNPKSLREKAGLLALINLLGIMDAFFGVTLPQSQEDLLKSVKEESEGMPVGEVSPPPLTESTSSLAIANVAPSAPLVGEPTLSLFSTLAKSLSAAPVTNERATGHSGGAPEGAGSLDGFDPKMLASMLSMASTLLKAFKPRASEDEKSEGPNDREGLAGESSQEPQKQPSPLQQALGFDPKILTMLLNIIANMDFMKQKVGDVKNQEPKLDVPEGSEDRTIEHKSVRHRPRLHEPTEHKQLTQEVIQRESGEQRPPEPKALAEPTPERGVPKQDASKREAPEALSKDPLISLIRKRPTARKVYHKPGLGIYRGWPGTPATQ